MRDGEVLVARRAADQHLPDLWEFPGGKVEAGEEPEAAALRELREETGLTAEVADPLIVFLHDYGDRRLRLHAFLVRASVGTPKLDGGRPWAFVSKDQLATLAMPEANQAILRALAWRMG